jgi:hypothetical protein
MMDGRRTMILGFQAVQGLMKALALTGIAYSAELHQEYIREVVAAAALLFPDLFDYDDNGSFRVSSISVARLLGENHEQVMRRIETAAETDWHVGPVH